MSVRNRVASVLAKTFGVDSASLTDEMGPEAIPRWDSLGHMKLIVELETEFGIRYELDDTMDAISVSAIVGQLSAMGVKDE